jgi:hypothetical protein
VIAMLSGFYLNCTFLFSSDESTSNPSNKQKALIWSGQELFIFIFFCIKCRNIAQLAKAKIMKNGQWEELHVPRR